MLASFQNRSEMQTENMTLKMWIYVKQKYTIKVKSELRIELSCWKWKLKLQIFFFIFLQDKWHNQTFKKLYWWKKFVEMWTFRLKKCNLKLTIARKYRLNVSIATSVGWWAVNWFISAKWNYVLRFHKSVHHSIKLCIQWRCNFLCKLVHDVGLL